MRSTVRLATLDLAVCALMAAILTAGKFVLSGLPNIEPVTLLLAAYTLSFGLRRTLWATGIFIGVEALIYGINTWWFSYLYLWPLWVLIVWLLKKQNSRVVWAVIAGFFGLSFGALCSLPYLLIGGVSMAFAYWVSGIPFDLLHCAGNFILAITLLPLFKQVLSTVYRKTIGRWETKKEP